MKGTLTSYTDKKGNVTNYEYNNTTDAIESVSQTLSSGETIENCYTYDTNNRLNTIEHNGFNYSFVYDSFGNVVETKVGNQTLSENTYGSYNGNLQGITYGHSSWIDYTYDDYGNMVSLSQNGEESFKWNYDSTGSLYSHEDLVNNQNYYYTYDSTGRLVRQSVLNSTNKSALYDAEYGYDLNNNVNRFTFLADGTSLTETFSYGKDNLPQSYTYPSGKTVTYVHDGLLRRYTNTINTDNPINHKYTYLLSNADSANRTTKIGWEHFNDYVYAYTYDRNGNITKITRRPNIDGAAYTTLQQFQYDELNQLIRADDIEKNCTQVYNYDNGGNITSVVTYPLTWGSLDGVTATDTKIYQYADSNWKDKLTSYDGNSIIYDEIGNPLAYDGYLLYWQNGRQLSQIQGNGVNYRFSYDADGLRTSKIAGGVKHEYYYVGSRLQYEKFGTNQLWFFYDASGVPSGIKYNNDYYYLETNWRGDVVKIYDSTGNLVVNYSYDAWGVPTSITDASGADITDSTHIANVNPLRYRGYYYDNETGLYYLQSRYYSPEMGRFLNADGYVSTGQGLSGTNMFAYCGNNPINNSDPSGMFWKKVGNWIKNAWNCVKNWSSKYIGFEDSSYIVVQDKKVFNLPSPSPVIVEVGNEASKKISTNGSSSNYVTAYSQRNLDNPIKSSKVGLQLKVKSLSLTSSYGLDNCGTSISIDGCDSSFAVSYVLNLSEFRAGIEISHTMKWDDSMNKNYVSFDMNGWYLVGKGAFAFLKKYISTPVSAPVPAPSN